MSMSSWQFVLHDKNRILNQIRCGLSSCNDYTDIESYSNLDNYRYIFSSKGLLVEVRGIGRRPPRSRAPAVLTGDLHRLPSRYRSPLAVLGLPTPCGSSSRHFRHAKRTLPGPRRGGDGGSRTRVRKHFQRTFSERSF